MSLAPIVFFAYRRPEHTRRSLESLSQNKGAKDSELFIYCDGIRHIEDQESVELVRKVVRSKQWCRTVHIIERENNIGLANSVISGVTEICDRHGKVIVIEDDLLLSTHFLKYMNTALDLYQNEHKVIQISGHMFPLDIQAVETNAFFLPFITSWGWATWQRAWKYFDPNTSGYNLLSNNRKLKYKFNLNNSYPYFKMLEQQINGNIDSWAIRWYLSTFMINGITLYPINTLVKNIGFDGSGTHCGVSLHPDTRIDIDQTWSMPINIQIDYRMTEIVFEYLRRLNMRFNLLQYIEKKFMELLY
jgi:hypothetical protein